MSCSSQYYLLVGTYTDVNNPDKSICVYNFNEKNGSATEKNHIAANNPSYLVASNDGKYIYSVNESADGKISAFSFDKKTAALTLLNSEDNNGSNPCYVAIDKTGKWLFAGNYSSGNLTLRPIQTNGTIGNTKQIVKHVGSSADKTRQETAHVHCTYISPDNKYLYVPDLGIDKVMIYPFDAATGTLDEKNATFYKANAGSGPRHITFTKNGTFGYLVEEMSGAVIVLKREENQLQKIQQINSLPAEEKGAGADIHLSPDEHFLYVSQRSNSTIQIFKVNKMTGTISFVSSQSTLGDFPRNFSIHPSGKFLVVGNQRSHFSVIFSIDKKTGLLTDTGKRINIQSPVSHVWIRKT
jgi:6-phosphogluconolactonase